MSPRNSRFRTAVSDLAIFIWRQLQFFSHWIVTTHFSKYFLLRLHLSSARLSRLDFSAIYKFGCLLRQSWIFCFSAGRFVCCFGQILVATCIGDITFTFGTAALLDSSLIAHTEVTSLTNSIQLVSKFAVSEMLSGLSLRRKSRDLTLLLKDI